MSPSGFSAAAPKSYGENSRERQVHRYVCRRAVERPPCRMRTGVRRARRRAAERAAERERRVGPFAQKRAASASSIVGRPSGAHHSRGRRRASLRFIAPARFDVGRLEHESAQHPRLLERMFEHVPRRRAVRAAVAAGAHESDELGERVDASRLPTKSAMTGDSSGALMIPMFNWGGGLASESRSFRIARARHYSVDAASSQNFPYWLYASTGSMPPISARRMSLSVGDDLLGLGDDLLDRARAA